MLGRARARARGGVVVGDQLLEASGVELAFLDAEEVAGWAGQDPVGAERAAEGVDVHLECVGCACRGRLAPDPVDQPVGRDHLVGMQQQLREQRAWPPAAERHRRAIVVEHLQRP